MKNRKFSSKLRRLTEKKDLVGLARLKTKKELEIEVIIGIIEQIVQKEVQRKKFGTYLPDLFYITREVDFGSENGRMSALYLYVQTEFIVQSLAKLSDPSSSDDLIRALGEILQECERDPETFKEIKKAYRAFRLRLPSPLKL